jgi:hypothetical protein
VRISEDFYFASICCHEAGHAVAWWERDIEVETIEVWKASLFTFDTRGLVTPGDCEGKLRDWAIGIAAGALAQIRFFVEHGLPEAQAESITAEGSGGDDQMLQDVCGFFFGEFSRSDVDAAAQLSLNHRWPLVCAVGEQLGRSNHLPGSVAR